ncbi:MAG TPA: DUF1080 domain-containing protein [Bacteroidales bacterium]|nr:DUF1080 domain-containing protein [Bacteroidales bacterium]
MNYKNLSYVLFALLLLGSCNNGSSNKEQWQPLFNGQDLQGWDTYLGPGFDTVTKTWDTIPVGLNIDPSKVFDVVDLNGEKVLRISGEKFGGISTKAEFENFHLQLEFKWGDKQWAPRETGKKDAGLMYYAVGPQGADGGFWMRSHEYQIEEGDCGDYWACAGAIADVRSVMRDDSTWIYNKDGELHTFSTESPEGRNCIKSVDAEKPSGEWNTVDLYCVGPTTVHMINGVVNMVLQNSRQTAGDSIIPLIKGKIQLESEGAEIFFRNIRVTSVDKIPDDIMKSQGLE